MLETAIIFIIILGALVFVHELGHFMMARKTGMPVEEFGIGFPPRIFSITRGETKYSINLIPLGGFVKITGEDGQGDNPNAFHHKKIWQRALVLVAGVTMNVLFAWLVLSIGFISGLPSIVDNTLSSQAQVRNEQLQIIQVIEDSPAAAADIAVGDVVTTIAGQTITTYDELAQAVQASAGDEISVTVLKGETETTVQLTPAQVDDTYQIGIGVTETGIVSYPWYLAIWEGLRATGQMLWQILTIFGVIIASLFTPESMASAISGPLGIARMTGQVVDLGYAYVLQFMAVLSLNLAIINIIPFPALDGGKLLFLAIEKIKGSPVNQRIENMIHNFGFIFLILLVIIITYNDILRF